MYDSVLDQSLVQAVPLQHFPAQSFPMIHPIHWLHSHFAVGGWSPLRRLSGMLTAHMTRIAPHNGFTWHPHRGLEIYTWVLEGKLYHEDSTGGNGVIGAGELQRMFSGDHIEHQELNRFDQPVRVIQIWYVADLSHRGLPPHYQQVRRADLPERRIGDANVYSLIGSDSPMDQHMTGRLSATVMDAGGESHILPPEPGEDLFLYVTDGSGTMLMDGGVALSQYDVVLASHEAGKVALRSAPEGELKFLSFYLASFLPQAQ